MSLGKLSGDSFQQGFWQLWPHVGPRRLPAAAADNRPGLGSETAAALEEEEEEEGEEEGQAVKKGESRSL